MRPLREHMGPRLLQSSGSSDEATNQRLLTAVRHSLASPGSDKKRIRKELERWKRKHRADWCDVDALLAAAQKSVDAGAEAAAAAAAQASAGGSSAADPAGSSSTGSKESQPAAATGGEAHQGTTTESTPVAQAGSGEGACCGDGEDMIQLSPCSTVSPTPCLLSACPSRADLCAGVGVTTSQPSATVAPSSTSQSLPSPTLLAEASAAAAAARRSASSQTSPPEPTTSTAAASSSSAVPPPSSSYTSNGVSQQDPNAHGASSSGRPPLPNRSAAGVKATAGAAKPAVNPSEDTWTVEQLLELPVGQLRPVVLADFEAALRIIMCTELDQSRQYEEWNNEYGSGADSKGGKSKHWMGMYS